MNILSSLLNFIGDKIGNVSMGTTATTLTGAIAEHESQINTVTGKVSRLEANIMERVTDCNNATDPKKIYYTNNDASNLNRPIENWCIIRSLYLNGNPASGNTWSCAQIGMPMNASAPRLFIRSKWVDGGWSSWREFTLKAVS